MKPERFDPTTAGASGRLGQALHGPWTHWLMLAFAGLAWTATPLVLARGAGLESPFLQAAVALAALALGSGLAWALGRSGRGAALPQRLAGWPAPSLAASLAAGLALRLAWILAFPAQPASDGAVYLELAQRLLADGHYEIAGNRAYWPPGYPLFLMPWLAAFPPRLAVALSQSALFAVGAAGCYHLAQRLAGDRAGKIAALLFALWPDLIALAGIPEKESVVLALLPWICLGVLSARRMAQAGAGPALGFCILVQPSLQLLPLAFALLVPLLHGWRKCGGALLLLAGVAAVLAPWTVRNHQLFGQFVLVSTNGGDVLYRANNPLADGGYTPAGAVDLSGLGEIEKDRTAKKLAGEWIAGHPAAFLGLMLEKQLRFMGDDSFGVFTTLKRGRGSDGPRLYAAAKLGANAWWLAAWLLVAVLAPGAARNPARFGIVVWPWLYLFALHSVFESNGKYHIPMLWVLCVWIACAAARCRPPCRETAQPLPGARENECISPERQYKQNPALS